MDFKDVLITPSFKDINLSIFISRPILMVVLFCFFLVYAILSSIIIYHWHAYGMKSYGVIVAESLFLFITLVLFVLAGLSLTYF